MVTTAQALKMAKPPIQAVPWTMATVISTSTATALTTLQLDNGPTFLASYSAGDFPNPGMRVWVALLPERPHVVSTIAKPIA